MSFATNFTAIKNRWTAAFPAIPLRFYQAQGSTKPPYATYAFSDIMPNEGDLITRDWIMTVTFTAYTTTDDAAFAIADAIVFNFDRISNIPGLYSSLAQSVSVEPHYTDQGSLWSVSVPVEFRFEQPV